MTLCRGALGLSEPTWYIRLPPASEDKGQYSMPRGGQGQAISSGFAPAKVLVRGLPLTRLLRLPRPAYQSYDLPGVLAGIARRGTTPGGLVAIGVRVSGEEGGLPARLISPASQHGIGTALPHALRAAKTGNPFRGPGCSFSTPCGPHQRGRITVGPLCHPKIR
ncbi:hypothetical protein EDB89DRAFT_1952569 [Lactarius sanguifluus]|nr:hypothetical protein EDB89DRAFT_1952569 [Lactarius sanguifluus]